MSVFYRSTRRWKWARLAVRRFVRTRFESLTSGTLQTARWAHAVRRGVYRRFDPANTVFGAIQIQTRVGCNYDCVFCPYHGGGPALFGGASFGQNMEERLFERLIDELAGLGFAGRISPYLMNEPLLDGRLPAFLSYARKRCPWAYLYVQTNGSVLKQDLLRDIFEAGVDELHVNDYTPDNRVLKRLAGYSLPGKFRVRLTLERRFPDEKLSNRAGNVATRPRLAEPLRLPCIKPFRQMFVTYNGKAVLCCQDWQFTQVLGDAAVEPLAAIWKNSAYERIRQHCRRADRSRNTLCAQCDFSGLW